MWSSWAVGATCNARTRGSSFPTPSTRIHAPRVPAHPQGWRADYACRDDPLDLDCEERSPSGTPGYETLRAIDGIDEPAPGSCAGGDELLADDDIVGPRKSQTHAQESLDVSVGLGDR